MPFQLTLCHLLRFLQRQRLELSLESRSAWCSKNSPEEWTYEDYSPRIRSADGTNARVPSVLEEYFSGSNSDRRLRTKQTHCLRTGKSFRKQCMLMPVMSPLFCS